MTNEPSAHYLDLGAVTVWLASLAQILPSIAAMLSVIWFAIRILESQTVQQLLGSYAWIRSKNGPAKDSD
jgi:chromate transport protein ChrA